MPAETVTNAYRVVHGEADALPSLVVDRYDRWAVVQLMSAGLEAFRAEIVDAIVSVLRVDGVLARNDAGLRSKEGLARETVLLHGDVPQEIEVDEHGIRYIAAPWTGQKTGAFLDQRENRRLVGEMSKGVALDCFSYHGSFAMHLAGRADRVVALDSSAQALDRARHNAELNRLTNIDFVETHALILKQKEKRVRDSTAIVRDPRHREDPQFDSAALRGSRNQQAGDALAREGRNVFTASAAYISRIVFSRCSKLRPRIVADDRTSRNARPAV